MSTKKRWGRVFLIGSMALLLLIVGAGFALAQSSQATPYGESRQIMGDQGAFSLMARGRFGARGAGMPGGYINGGELLANALGITPAELQSAQSDAFEKALAQAVTDGLITQAQADRLLSRGGFGGRALGFLPGDYDEDALLAGALGITVEELAAARDGAIEKAVEAGLITQAQANDMQVAKMIREAVEDARQTALEKAVEAGLITQAQADNMLRQKEHGFGFGGPRGFQGGPEHGRFGQGRRGFGGFPFQNEESPATPPANS